MAAERAASPTRVRVLLLVLAAVSLLALMINRLGAPTMPGRQASAPPARGAGTSAASTGQGDLDVQLEALRADRPSPADTERNPFRFQVPPPPPSPDAFQPPPAETFGPPPGPIGPPPPAVKPITVRFIGVLERQGETIAIFVDCTEGRRTPYAREGEIVDGRYRLIKIGAESVVIEHLDGTGRTTLAKSGQECVR